MELINGKEIADNILNQVREEILDYKYTINAKIILASNDPASLTYVKMKSKRAAEVGINLEIVEVGIEKDYEYILSLINEYNLDDSINGIMVQLPMYKHIQEYKSFILNSIRPDKDIDGLSDIQLGLSSNNNSQSLPPATVEAIIECLNFCHEDNITWNTLKNNFVKLDDNFFTGKNITIINNSNLIGKPLALILSSLNATVTIANKFTKNLKDLCLNADIVISATGSINLVDHTFFKQDTIVVDVTSIKHNDLFFGDVKLSKELENKLSFITLVPGGVGPVTISCLLRNCLRAYKMQNSNF